MTMRFVHLFVVAALVCAAAYVYKIKFDSTLQAERLAKLAIDLRRERDAIAALRAEWSKLESPARIQGLANRHLSLRPTDPTQVGSTADAIDRLPERPLEAAPSGPSDPIGAMIETIDPEGPTGSISPPAAVPGPSGGR
jgi:hypothetical protein